MIVVEPMPSSIARRVGSGMQSMARRRSAAGRRRLTAPPLRLSYDAVASRAVRLGGRVEWFKGVPASERRVAMRLGLHVGYWGLGLTAEQQLEIVREAEAAGFDSVWAAEAYGSDTATVLAWLAANTERIKIGSALFPIARPSPPA